MGNLPVVSRFMKGIFELQPPNPKISSTWPVAKANDILQNLNSVEQLSHTKLSLKLSTLLALIPAARVHELIASNLSNVIKKRDCEKCEKLSEELSWKGVIFSGLFK